MKGQIASILSKEVNLNMQEIEQLIEIPKDSSLGDYAFPCFTLAKTLKKSPVEIAKELASKINAKKSGDFEKVAAVGPYVNFFINRNQLAAQTLKEIEKQKEKYGSSNQGKNQKILIEMSSPNIAKPFGIGHLRSTIIGNSIANISSFLGFKTLKLNYLGDWGTQFGRLIVSYKKSGDLKKLKKDPIKHLLELYVKAQTEDFDEEARNEFKKMEDGDKDILKLWKTFKSLSVKELDKVYKELGIKFDVIDGESNYNKNMPSIVQELTKKGLLEKSEGAEIVSLEKYNLGVCIIKKSDGATLYATRDIAAAISRQTKYKPARMLYEVGSEQKLHFQQIFKVLELLGHNWAKNLTHIEHGLYLDAEGKKLATRKGKSLFMEDILQETQDLTKKEIIKREPEISKADLESRTKAISLAAIFYGDLKNQRANDIVFDIERFISFEGDTGPYLLYTYARAKSILRKSKFKGKFSISNLNEQEKQLIIQLNQFQEIVQHAYTNLAPNIIANYAFQLAQSFNEFYHHNQVIGSKEESFRLALVQATAQVLKNALSLLGIQVLEKM